MSPLSMIQSTADPSFSQKGCSKGVSHQPVVPIEKATFVQYDESTYLDDYSYLAAVPTSVFNYQNQLYSHPLLFFDDTHYHEEKKVTLNAKVGTDYFMQDWMSYCDQKLDEITLINVDEDKLDVTWKADQYHTISENTPQNIASKLALHDWSHSDEAVVSVIPEQYSKEKEIVSDSVTGKIFPEEVNTDTSFSLSQTNSLNPVFHEFTVPKEYTFIKAETWWDCLILGPGIMAPTGDPDIQLYCKQDDGWMQASAASFWNVYQPAGREYTQSHVYEPGPWRVGITDLPTEGDVPEKQFLGGNIILQGSLLEALKPKVTYHVDVTMFPGTIIDFPDSPPFGCNDATITVSWKDSNINLGCSIIGPGGENIFTSLNNTGSSSHTIHLDTLGLCKETENYQISVFSLHSLSKEVSFTVDYQWKQEITKDESDALTSATQGAVLASMHNAPLLYTNTSELSSETREVLRKLGVQTIHLVDIGNHLDQRVKQELQTIATTTSYENYESIYDAIQKDSTSNDIVFSTIDPWTTYYLGELCPAEETEKALFIGPAAYLAAHHGCPVFIVDNHPLLSSAVTWHNEFWKRNADDRYFNPPSTAEMVLTGKRIYEFLDHYGFDKEGEEFIVTVADQYDIGIPWDRIFPGVAHAGRICGSPVDTSNWIARTVFYPAIVFENPGLQRELSLINGSKSTRDIGAITTRRNLFNFYSTFNLGSYYKIRESQTEEFSFPVQCSFIAHRHRFNERASNYYGSTYQCANGLIPGVTASMEPIDQGTIEKYTGKNGAYFPDMTESEIIPLYLERGGYSPVFSTNVSAVVNNVNEGVLLWIHISHGLETEGGKAEFWDPNEGFEKYSRFANIAKTVDQLQEKLNFLSKIPLLGSFFNIIHSFDVLDDPNPWRGYEWYLGSTDEPDSMSMDIKGFVPFTNIKLPLLPATGQDWVLSRKPFREGLNDIIPFINPFSEEDYYDGVIGTAGFSRLQNSFKNSLEIEKDLRNLHSAGFITSMCQTSNTYLHLMLIRHGSVFQVQDPWPTSWYGAVWRQSIPRDIILGKTVGEAYSNGMKHVGTLYLSEPSQWWWDTAENVVYFGDPSLRMYVPGLEYSEQNSWDKPDTLEFNKEASFQGHTPFGANSYPFAADGNNFLIYLILLFIGSIFLIFYALLRGKKNEK